MIRILAVVPAYNEALNILSVVQNIFDVQKPQSGFQLDVCVVNDGSKDKTGEIAESTHAIVLNLPYNVGIGGAVQTGFQYAVEHDYDIAIQVDGDGQHNPQFIQPIIKPILDGVADVVIASRFLDKQGFQSTWTRRIGIKLFEWVNSLIIKQRITDNTSGFRAYNRKAIKLLAKNYPIDYPEPEAVIVLGLRGFRITEIPVVMRERSKGESSIGSWASFYYVVKVFLAIFINIFKIRD